LIERVIDFHFTSAVVSVASSQWRALSSTICVEWLQNAFNFC